jgi:hypothetical protein
MCVRPGRRGGREVLVVEAWGTGEAEEGEGESAAAEFCRDTDFRWHPLQFSVLWIRRGIPRLFGRKIS